MSSPTFFFGNVNHTRGPFLEVYDLTLEKRLPGIVEWATKHDPTFVGLFEVNRVGAVLLAEHLHRVGYTCEIIPYCDNAGSFCYVIGARGGACFRKLGHVYFTQTGLDITRLLETKSKHIKSAHNGFTEYTKSMPLFELYVPASGEKLVAIVGLMHIGLTSAHRRYAAGMCDQVMNELAEALGEDVPIFVGGDMNCFDSSDIFPSYDEPQFKAMAADWNSWIPLSKKYKSSFHSFRYDINRFMNEKEAEINTQLLEEYMRADDIEKEEFKTRIRMHHDQIIARCEVPPKVIGVDRMFQHPRSEDILDGPILDGVFGYKFGGFAVPPEVELVESRGVSDHDGILLQI